MTSLIIGWTFVLPILTDFGMRNLLIIGMLLCGAFFAGWFTIERDGDRTRIEINKTEIKDDLSDLSERGRDYLDRRRESQDSQGRERDVRYQDEYDRTDGAAYRNTGSYEERQRFQEGEGQYRYRDGFDGRTGTDSRYEPLPRYPSAGPQRYGEDPRLQDQRYIERYDRTPAQPEYQRTQTDRRSF